MSDLLETLRAFDALRDGKPKGDVVAEQTLDGVAPAYAGADALDGLSRPIRHAFSQMGIESLYEHQAEAIRRALAGSNVVLQAPTASGKTLAFQAPMIQTLREERGAHALMIYPNKALALDQRDQLMRLAENVPGPRIGSWWYDGDTEREHRSAIRQKPPHILITNPDMLHNSFLGHAEQWTQFYRGLKWVIIDEMHEYRGYFGSNVAMILRRFSHHLAALGVRPQFFLCSATCANPQEHAENLTGLEFEEVNAAYTMRPRRRFTFVQPDIPDYRYWDILQLRAVKAGLACLAEGKSVLVFCPTRKFAENCFPIAAREIQELQEQDGPILDPDTVKVFRAGLSTDERHEIQNGLKTGAVRLVFTTNALELGIDIGGLDGVILAGFPDSMMSAWQRIGRAGRNWSSDAFVLYYARNNPLDRFYAANLDAFLAKPLDDLVVNPANEDLIERHLPSLLYETPGGLDSAESEAILGPAMYQAAKEKLGSGAEPVRSGRWRPHFGLNIRGGGGSTFTLKDGSRQIGTLSDQQQFREAYQRAIYLHGGRTYRVKEVSLGGSGGEITLESAEPYLRTNPSIFTHVTEQDIYDGLRWACDDGDIAAFHGKVLITDMVNSVQEIDERSGAVIDQWQPQHNSARFDNAHAFWIVRDSSDVAESEGIGALQQLLRVGALFLIPLDAHDVVPHGVAKEQKAYIVESYPGGIGVARKMLEKWQQVLDVGIKIALSCSCVRGCPNCIVPPRAREELDKRIGIELAHQMLAATEQHPAYRFAQGIWEPTGREKM